MLIASGGNDRRSTVYCLIYLSHCLSAWGDRMWDFAVGLYMVILYPDSLLLTATLGFATSLSVIVFGSLLGSWIDNSKRITSATLSIIVQNTAVVFGSTALVLTFAYYDDIQLLWNGMLQTFIYILIISASIIAKLASVTSDIAIERDWIVVLTDGDENNLATMNSVMRTIDLTTKILAPVAIGALISYWSMMAGAIFIAGWNVLSGCAEVYLLMTIYKWMPQLVKDERITGVKRKGAFKETWNGWRLYFNHPVKLAGIGLSCLYMTVLGFDQITVGYIYSQGVAESFIGVLTAFGAITGIFGSISYPFIRKCLGKNPTAILGYVLNSICTLVCVVSIFMPGSPFEPSAILNPYNSGNSTTTPHETLTIDQLWEQRLNIFYFIIGIVLARFGLWIADLSVAQLLQDSVEENQRGVINGVQNSLNQAMDLIKFLLVIILPSPATFGYLIIATWIFSCLSCLLHAIFSFRGRKGGQRCSSMESVGMLAGMSQTTPGCSPEETVNEETPLLMQK